MLRNKDGQLNFIPLLSLLFGSVLVVSAVVVNSTENLSSDSILNNSVFENISLNLTIPFVDILYINQSDNLTLNETLNNLTDLPIINQSTNLSEEPIIANLSNLTITNYSALIMENKSINNISKLAKLFNEDNLEFDRELRLKYLNKNKNFSNINFKKIYGDEKYQLKIDSKQDKIRGIEISNNTYVVDLLYCEISGRYCTFRINGVPVNQIFSSVGITSVKKNTFDIDGNYVLKINSIEFNHCDNKRFCHLGYEGYSIVDVSIERKNE